MLVSCPHCATEYDVPEAALANRSRLLRCGNCGHQWRLENDPVANTTPATLTAALPEQAAPTTDLGWTPPVIPAPAEDIILPSAEIETRKFGHPADASARVALEAAALQEGTTPLHLAEEESEAQAAAETNTAIGLPLNGDVSPDPQDRFAALVDATRNKTTDVEPELLPPPPRVRTSNKPFFVLLLVLLVIAVAVLERRQIMHLFPASTKFFHAIGLA